MTSEPVVYLNGEYVEMKDAYVSVNDRGFLLGDACYEATPFYSGRAVRLEQHLDRLHQSLCAVAIDFNVRELDNVHRRLIEENHLATESFAMVYVQVTRGVAPRSHSFPKTAVAPTVYAFAKALPMVPPLEYPRPIAAISHPDIRWLLPRLKATCLLPNVLAQQAAEESGAVDVVLHRDGVVTEGTHNNVFVVIEGAIVTPPADDLILRGITRDMVIDIASSIGVPVDERRVMLDEVRNAQELFFTGTTTEVRPATILDSEPIGDGTVGPTTTELALAYRDAVTAP